MQVLGRAFPARSLKLQMSLFVTLLYVVTTALVVAALLYYVRGEMKRTLTDQQYTLLQRVADELDQKIAVRQQALARIAQITPADATIDAEAARSYIERQPVLVTLFDTLYIYSPELKPLAVYPQNNVGEISQTDFIKRTFIGGEALVTGPLPSTWRPEHLIYMTAPVYGDTGNIVAVLVGGIEVLRFDFVGGIQQTRIGQSGNFFLTTRDGTMIVSRFPERIGLTVPPAARGAVLEKALAGWEGTEEGATGFGLRALLSYKWLDNAEWLLGTLLPVNEAYAPIQRAQERILWIALLFALLTAPLVWWMTQHFIAPLDVLRRSMRIYRDNPAANIEVPAARYREIADLGREFNMLIAARRQAAVELEQAQDALRQSQKMEAVGKLADRVAHDIGNLLHAVNGYFRLIHQSPQDVECVRQCAENGLRAVDRGVRLTSQLLNFSRTQRLELQPVHMGKLVTGMEELLVRTCGPAVRVALKPQSGDAHALADPIQLEMALLNLAVNARDAMPQGGTLTIVTSLQALEHDPLLPPGRYVEVRVSDSGIGMPEEVRTRAFDPFFTTKAVGKGTGLGLSQVYGLAQQAGGTARIESRPNAGTTVSLLLPWTPPPAPVIAAEVERTGQATVLVVDDDIEVRALMSELLNRFGYAVCEAVDGPAGLLAMEQARPDVLLVDYTMPGMNGLQFAQAVRARDPDVPIVFASAYADPAMIRAVMGPDTQVLRKPFQMEELLAAISRAMSKAKAPTQDAAKVDPAKA